MASTAGTETRLGRAATITAMARGFKFWIAFGFLLAAGLALFRAFGGSEPEPEHSGLMPSEPIAGSGPAESRASVEAERIEAQGSVAVPHDSGEERVDAWNTHAPLVGRVLAEKSRLPVAHMSLRIEGESVEDVTTDAEGRFRTRQSFGAGRLEIWFVDHEPLPRSPFGSHLRTFPIRPSSYLDPDWEPDGAELEIEVAVGPTWNLKLVPEPELPVEEFLVRLRTLPRGERPGPIVFANGVELEAVFMRAVGWSTITRLRDDDGTWARFPELDSHVLGSGPPWMLSVEGSDGSWYGEAAVNSVSNESPMDLTVELQPLAALALRVVDPDGYPEAGIDVNLIRIGADGEELERISWRSEQDGQYTFDMLPPGKYLLMATSLRHVTFEATLWLGDRERRELDLVCNLKPVGGSITGTLESATDALPRHSRSATIALRRAGEERLLQRVEPQWKKIDDMWECRFYLGNLPLDEYELSVEDTVWNYAWEPSRLRVVPPAEDLVFVRQDNLPEVELKFQVGYQPKQASESPRLHLSYRINGGPERSKSFGEEPHLRIAEGLPLTWTLWADGYVPQRGDLESFGPAENGTRVAAVVLRKGWGARIQVMGDIPGDPRPIAGALVLLDGAAVGATDYQGMLDVALESRPGRVEVLKTGWTMRGGNALPRDSTKIEVRMSPVH
jgi:hypothetical protein